MADENQKDLTSRAAGFFGTTPVVVILVAACVSMMLSFGFRNSYGVFLPSVSLELGWGREVLALSLAIQNLIWGFSQPIAGMIAEKYGSNRVIAVCAVLYAVGLAGSAMMFSPLASHVFAGFFVGVGLGGTSNAIILAVVGRSVSPAFRSTALGIAMASASGGQLLIVPLAAELVVNFDWRTALWLFAILTVFILIAAPFLGGKPKQSGAEFTFEQTLGEALKEATSNRSYLLLTAGFFVCGFHVSFIGVHLPAYVADLGLGLTVGSWAVALIGGANIIGALLAGYLGGKYSKPYLLSAIYLGRGVVILWLLFMPPSIFVIFTFAIAMGFLWLSTVPLTSGLVGQMFGMRFMATLFGIVFLSHQVGAFLGVWLGGYLYDATGSYDVVWWMSIALAVFAGLVHWPIDERPVERVAAAS